MANNPRYFNRFATAVFRNYRSMFSPFAVSRRRRLRMGSLFIESLMGIFVLGVGASAFFAMMPVMQRSQKIARSEQIAVQLCNRMVEHIQLLKANDIKPETLNGLNLLDNVQPNPPVYSFKDIPLDNASGYSPAKLLHEAEAWMTIETLPSGSKRVLLSISWTAETKVRRSVQTGTIVGAYR